MATTEKKLKIGARFITATSPLPHLFVKKKYKNKKSYFLRRVKKNLRTQKRGKIWADNPPPPKHSQHRHFTFLVAN